MRLRHKKPINSYVGQANPDSNVLSGSFQDAIDEEFAKASMQSKKARVVKQRPANEQTRKYAEILCEFVSVVNQGKFYATQIIETTALNFRPPSTRTSRRPLALSQTSTICT